MAKKRVVKVSKSQNQKRSKWDQYLRLDWKEFYLIFIAWFLFIVLHNLIAIIFNYKEKVLLVIIEWIIPFFLVMAVLYTIWKRKTK